MPEEVVSDSDRSRFTCPVELLIRGGQEGNPRYVYTFSRAADINDPRTLSLLRNIISDSDDIHIRSHSLQALFETCPEDASRLIESIIQDRNDELGDTALFYLNDDIMGMEPVSISDEALEMIAVSQDPVLRKRVIRVLSEMNSIRSNELLMRLLEAPEVSVRIQAAFRLGKHGFRNAVSSLRKLLDDCGEEDRETVVVALARLGDRSVIPYARDLLKGDLRSFLDGVKALYLLGEMSASEVMNRVLERVSDLDVLMYCQQAGWMICGIADESFIEPVIELAEKGEGYGQRLAYECICVLDDRRIHDLVLRKAEDPSACEEILECLPGLQDPKALDLILIEFDRGILPNRQSLWRLHSIVQRNMSADEVTDDRIRERLKDEDTLDRILTTLFEFYAKLRLIEVRYPTKDSFNNYDYYEKHQILEIASLLGAKSVWRIIDAMLEDPSDLIIMEAALAYASIEVEFALEALVKLIISTDNAVIRWETAGHIAEHWGNRRIDELAGILDREDVELIWPVIEIIGYLRSPDAVQPLRTLLEHRDWWIRTSAVRALGMIGDSSVTDDLIELLSDECEHVRIRVKEVLGSMDI